MKILKKTKSMTFEEALKNPSLAHFHDAIRFVKDKPNKDIFPQKYEEGVISVALETVFELFEENPKVSLKKVLRLVIKHLPKDITPLLMSKVIQKAIEEWTNLVEDAQKEGLMLVAA